MIPMQDLMTDCIQSEHLCEDGTIKSLQRSTRRHSYRAAFKIVNMLLCSTEESQNSRLFLQLSRLPPTQGRQNVPEQVYLIHLIATICQCQPSLICRSEYDRGPNTFSPEGRLFQVMMIMPGFEQLSLTFTE